MQGLDGEEGLDGAGGAEQVADGALGRGHVDFGGAGLVGAGRRGGGAGVVGGAAEQTHNGGVLSDVAEPCGRSVGVDVADVGGLDVAGTQRHGHGPVRAVAVFGRRRDVDGVAGHAVAHELGVDGGAAGLGVVQLLEDEAAGALAHDEAGAGAVKGPGREGRVGDGAQGLCAREAGNGERVHGGLCGAGEHDVGHAGPDVHGCVSDGVGARCAGRGGRVVGAFESVDDGDVACGHVVEQPWDEERRDLPVAAGVERRDVVDDIVKPANARSDTHAGCDLVGLVCGAPVGVLEGLLSGGERVLRKEGHTPCDGLVDPLRCVPFALCLGALGDDAADGAGDLRVVLEEGVPEGDDAGVACEEGLPYVGDADAKGRDDAEASDDHSFHDDDGDVEWSGW